MSRKQTARTGAAGRLRRPGERAAGHPLARSGVPTDGRHTAVRHGGAPDRETDAGRERIAATLEALAREQRTLAIWLCGEYGALTFEDAEDLVAEALSRVNGELPSQLPAARAYLRKMLQRDAIDELRHRHGRRPREKAQRPKLVALDELPDGIEPAGSQTADGELAERATRTASQAAVQRALAALPEQERETLRMRYLDELAPAAICRGLGLSRTQYERRLTDGIRHALDALIADAPLPACRRVRATITASPGRLAADDAARRDAHLEECVACRAFERRALGLLALTPAGHALGWWAQLRLKAEGLVQRGVEAAGTSSGADATTATAAGGAGAAGGAAAGGFLAGGAAVKVAAVCSSAAVAAVCVAQVGPTPQDRPSRQQTGVAASKPARAPVEPTPTPVGTPWAPTTPEATSESGTATARDGDRARSRRRRTSEGAREAEPPAPSDAASLEFGPEGAGGEPEPSTAAATASASSAGSSSSPSSPEASADRPQPASGSGASEFEP